MVMEFRNIVVEYRRSYIYIYICIYSVRHKPLIASLSAPDQRTSMKLSNRHWYAYYPLPFNHNFNESKRLQNVNVRKTRFYRLLNIFRSLFFFCYEVREEKFRISAEDMKQAYKPFRA